MDSKKHNIGRKPRIALDLVYDVIKDVAEEFFNVEGNLIPYSHPIWCTISNNLDGKIKTHTLYSYVQQDRNLWQTKLREIAGKTIKYPECINSHDEENFNHDKSFSDTDEGSIDGLTDSRQYFDFDIPYREYVKMSPVDVSYGKNKHKKTYSVLKQGVWTNVVNDWFIKCCKIPCNIIYKRCRIANDFSKAKYFLDFSGKCKDCLAVVVGWADKKPIEGMPIHINIIIENMDMMHNHTSKRPLNGEKRREVGVELSKDCANNWRRQAVSSLTFGEKIPANVYRNDVLWKCKQLEKDKNLGITENCPIMSLVELSHAQYSGSIHTVCAKPFIVHYWTPCQLVVYKSMQKSYVRLTIDATGSIVSKIKRTKERVLSSHIFLYEAVVSNGTYQTSVTQMISEKQDTFTIFSWLTLWMNDGVSAPQESVCDFSMALLGAITRAFCGGMTVCTYVESCFEILIEKKLSNQQLSCYVRIDVAHVIKMVCRWKCWKGTKTYKLKAFFIRCMVLLINCEYLDEFKDILIDIFTVCTNEYDGKNKSVPNTNTPAEAARLRLLDLIKGNCPSDITNISDQEILVSYQDGFDDNDEDIQEDNTSCLNIFLNQIEEQCFIHSTVEGDRLNAYYVPEFKTSLMRLCKKFPLWTNVMKRYFKSPYSTATSASVEGEFSELKHSILRNESRLIAADRFVVTHLRSLENTMKMVRSEQLFPKTSTAFNDFEISKHITSIPSRRPEILNSIPSRIDTVQSPKNVNLSKSSSSTSSSSSEDILTTEECWRGFKSKRTGPLQKFNKKVKICEKAIMEQQNICEELMKITPKLKIPTKRRTKYMEACPEIDRVLNKAQTRSSKTILLQNGNLTTPCSLNKTKYVVSNTCAFDSLVFGIAMAYTDFPAYRSFINSSNNDFLRFVKEIVNHGSSTIMYSSRLKLLKTIFQTVNCVNNVQLLNAECNVNFIINGLMRRVPSCIEDISCSNEKCSNLKKSHSSPTIILSPTDGRRIINDGISSLSDIISGFKKNEAEVCMLPSNGLVCGGTKKVTRQLQAHLFIELDALLFDAVHTISCQLTDIPTEINVDNDKFTLVAAITHANGHYVTYAKRVNNVWEIHNDLERMTKRLNNQKVSPHILIYVRNN